MIGSIILLITLSILVLVTISITVYMAIDSFKEDEKLVGIFYIMVTIFVIGTITGWILITLGI